LNNHYDKLDDGIYVDYHSRDGYSIYLADTKVKYTVHANDGRYLGDHLLATIAYIRQNRASNNYYKP